jgi:hypothetical protein
MCRIWQFSTARAFPDPPLTFLNNINEACWLEINKKKIISHHGRTNRELLIFLRKQFPQIGIY